MEKPIKKPYNKPVTTLYRVKTANFEGPLDLLLDLITKRKLFVSDVSLSEVTDDFIAYIETHDSFPLGESAEFIVVASTLMLIKSRSLLPQLELTEEEQESIEDLEMRLRVYQRVKELALTLKKIYGKDVIFDKSPTKNVPVVFSPDSKTDTENLLRVLESVLDSLPKKEALPKVVVKKMITLEETIEKLAERVAKGLKTNFTDFVGTDLQASGKLTPEKKVSIIVGFLAMLELVKRGAIRVSQEGGEIEMETEGVRLPQYI